LSWRLNVDKEDADVRPNSRLFQVLAAATWKAQSPTARCVTGTMSADVNANDKRCHKSTKVKELSDYYRPFLIALWQDA